MKELVEKQLKEIQEACLSSYQRGYKEGFYDACKQMRAITENLAESVEEAMGGEE